MGKPTGMGHKALDHLDSDSDRTITENSENSSNEEYQMYKRTIPNSSGAFDHKNMKDEGYYKGSERMKPVYSTAQTKEQTEIVTYKNETKSDQTNYDEDKFESEDDDDDDFHLPKDHQ